MIDRTKTFLGRILFPPMWILLLIPIISFTALIFVFVSDNTDSTPAYICYCMSAYSLSIWTAALLKLIKRGKALVTSLPIVSKYQSDLAFRGKISLYEGIVVNFFYVIFRIAAGIRYASIWFISMAVYYLVLGCLRLYLAICYHRRNSKTEYSCYRNTAWLLFLLNIPMGGMIIQMIWANSGFSYPGYVIYLSALYTFITMTTSVINLVRFRRFGSPILSAAKILNFISAMMSILGLQTAMISRFSEDEEDFRLMMNSISGGFVYGIVILIAVLMLLRSRQRKGTVESIE